MSTSNNEANVTTLDVGSAELTDIQKEEFEAAIKRAAEKSENVFFNCYVDSILRSLDYSQLQILKLIRQGEYTDIRAERGRKNSCGFTSAFKFAGESEACHIRGWFDKSTKEVLVMDIFMSADMSI